MPKGKDDSACPVCGGQIDPETKKCTTCGSSPPKKKKKGGKKVQISLVDDVPKGKRKAKKKEDKKEEKSDDKKPQEEKPEEPSKEEKTEEKKKEKTADLNDKPLLSTEPEKISNEDKALADWLSGEKGGEELGEWLGGDAPPEKKKDDAEEAPDDKKKKGKPSKDEEDEALKKWLSGEEDTLKDWLGEEPDAEKKAEDVGPVGKELVEREKLLNEREEALAEKEKEIEGLKIQMEEYKKAVEGEFDKIKSGEFDPLVILEETARLNKELQVEIKNRKQLEDEIVQVKKGSLAVIKYVKAQGMQDKGGVAKSLKKKLSEETKKREDIEASLKAKEETLAELKKELDAGLKDLPDDAKAAKKLELGFMEKEKELNAKITTLENRQKDMEKQVRNGSAGAEADSELQQRVMAELASKEQEFIEKEADMKKQILDLEEKLHEFEIDDKLRAEKKDLSGKSDGEISDEMDRKIRELQVKEKSLLVREDEIQRLKEQLSKTEEEMKKIKEPLAFKDEEMLRREEDLVYREQMLIEERRKMEEALRESGSLEAHDMKLKLEELQGQINKKEDELRAKEQYMQAKMEDLRLREQGLIGEEIEAREEDRMIELKIDKVKIGDRRLDDLLLGGIPFGNNILIYGPPFTGKEITINSFIAEGLKKGIPACWVITDKMPSEIREEMMFIVSGYEEYEKLGLVKYVDAYSRGIGVDDVEANVTYVEDTTDTKAIMKAVDGIAKEFLDKHDYYRLAFRSISTIIAYLDSSAAFKFLQPFCGKRKRDRAVSLFAIEKGMHNEQDIQMIGSVTDGMIDFKLEQLKTFLCIKGIGDVQSRAWIDYSYSKQGLIIGSFSLDHIR